MKGKQLVTGVFAPYRVLRHLPKSLKKVTNDRKVGQSLFHTTVAQSKAFPVSSEHTKAIQLSPEGQSMGCWFTNSEH